MASKEKLVSRHHGRWLGAGWGWWFWLGLIEAQKEKTFELARKIECFMACSCWASTHFTQNTAEIKRETSKFLDIRTGNPNGKKVRVGRNRTSETWRSQESHWMQRWTSASFGWDHVFLSLWIPQWQCCVTVSIFDWPHPWHADLEPEKHEAQTELEIPK